MKARVRLKLQQAEMRAQPKPRTTRHSATAGPNGLKRRIAATVLAYERGWSPAKIARHFGWEREQVEAWFEAGKPLL